MITIFYAIMLGMTFCAVCTDKILGPWTTY